MQQTSGGTYLVCRVNERNVLRKKLAWLSSVFLLAAAFTVAPAVAENQTGDSEMMVCVDWTTKNLRYSKHWETCPSKTAEMFISKSSGDELNQQGVTLDQASGFSFLSGTADPTDTNGSIGDMYFATTSKKLFGPKTTSGWGTGTDLRGPRGFSGGGGGGTQGPTGPQGPAGPAGPQGATGPSGSDGADGADGADGEDGADGAPAESRPAKFSKQTQRLSLDDTDFLTGFEDLEPGLFLYQGVAEVVLSDPDDADADDAYIAAGYCDVTVYSIETEIQEQYRHHWYKSATGFGVNFAFSGHLTISDSPAEDFVTVDCKADYDPELPYAFDMNLAFTMIPVGSLELDPDSVQDPRAAEVGPLA